MKNNLIMQYKENERKHIRLKKKENKKGEQKF